MLNASPYESTAKKENYTEKEQKPVRNPLVSVIIPAYNSERYLAEAVESVLRQTMPNFEIMVLDDCSTDGTRSVAEQLAEKDKRIHVFSNPQNLGVARTRNRGLTNARGEYIALLDSDDLWEPDKLEKQLALMRETGCDLCYSSYDYFDKNGRQVYHPYLPPETIHYKGLLKENAIGLSSVVLRKSAMGGSQFDEKFFHEDYVLWLKLLRTGAVARGIPEVLTHNRVGGRSNNKWESLKNRWRIYRVSEGLSFISSCWYLAFYAAAGMRKYKN